MVFSVPQERAADAKRLKKLEGNDNFTWIGAALQQAAFWARAQEALLAKPQPRYTDILRWA